MKSKLVKIAVVVLAPILIIGIAGAAQSQKNLKVPRITILNDIREDMPKGVKGARMIDGAGNYQTCFLNGAYSRPGKQTATEWACWSDKVRK